MPVPIADPLDYYACHGQITNPGTYASLLEDLPVDIPALCQVAIDTLDVPRDQFLVAGKAWQLCRKGQADPDRFGFQAERGEWFIQDSLVQDLASLNKMELLCWDGWALADRDPQQAVSVKDAALLDQVAVLTQADNPAFPEMRTLYENEARLRVPLCIRSYTRTGVRKIPLTDVV